MATAHAKYTDMVRFAIDHTFFLSLAFGALTGCCGRTSRAGTESGSTTVAGPRPGAPRTGGHERA
ncbi:hypothetical protein FBZ81_101198 [Azospirillum brasilense]|nr:hypothetical protein OH82_05857 [Azospirillum brasilense]TWB86273.1 hypothetical protein FBZ81_101198 [Azospirillum brasilense]